ncbi:MAG: HAMP domain-containing histidine kinase [Gammaproteobacteria bacterium]|nr:HAMP domain-containing histidine kinase [Gammaproteobacteria bacterium]MBU1654366.1 HAMP domain-containing histidine kinase [Gammaproteobacteria bacterium]MBU1961993.1 HAMP domain-containing histidine kinase [Gammaproteobacteria bacterium]
MTRHSLRVRLLVAAAFSIGIALVIAGFALVSLFERHVERSLDAELETYLAELIGHIEADGNGDISLKQGLPDPRFDQPLSGRYWQIQDDDHHLLIRSRSLWDGILPLPHDQLSLGVVHRHELPGPTEQPLLVREEQVVLLPETKALRLRFAVAIDRSDLIAARQAFTQDILPYLLLLAIAFLAATWLQVWMGLSPLDKIRRGVLAIRTGAEQRLPNCYPDEVRPLVDEINELLDSRDQAVENARAWTADLAHGLKTPLTALTADAQHLRSQGHGAMAAGLEQLAETMRRRVDRELIRARLRSEASKPPSNADLVKALQGVIATLRRTPAGERLEWEATLPAEAEVGLPKDDLAELIGNLLDNASKWARSRVSIRLVRGKEWQLSIEDDGPGVPPEQCQLLGERGLRLDQQTRGSGLGLAIARDIVAAYQGTLLFDRSPLGGLAVSLSLRAGKREIEPGAGHS